MKKIETAHSDRNSGHYSPGIVHNGLLFVSGQLPLDPETRRVPEGGIEAEMRQALANLDEVLAAAGSSRQRVLKLGVYVPDIEYWPTVNRVCAEFFGEHRPARVVLPTGNLHFGCLVEVDAVAAVD